MNNTIVNELKTTMESKVSAYVSAYNSHDKTKAEMKTMKAAAKAAVDAYNLGLSKETYKQWNTEGDPIKTAIRMRKIPGAQRVTYKTDDADTMAASYHDADFKANLPMMQAVLGKDVFADPDWFARVEKLAYLIANRVNKELGAKATFAYKVSSAAEAFNFPAGSNPASIDNMATALQTVFDSILVIPDENGENRIKADIVEDMDGNKQCPAWAYVRELMTAEGDADGEVAIRNTGKMTDLIAGAMHQIMTSGDFCAKAEDAFVMPEDETGNAAESGEDAE